MIFYWNRGNRKFHYINSILYLYFVQDSVYFPEEKSPLETIVPLVGPAGQRHLRPPPNMFTYLVSMFPKTFVLNPDSY